jgi:acyl-CoA synthetase (AMP-forming)/AMP-acid ligase II
MSFTQIHGVAPPTDGTVTLPETVDFHRKHNPTVPVYVFIEDEASNTTNVAHLEFGRACDRVAHYLRPGRHGPDREVVAVLALSDSLLYQAIVIGIMRAGLIVRVTLQFIFCFVVLCLV